MTADDRAAQISARLAAATPGPWRTHDSKYLGGKYVTRDEANAHTIVHATETWAKPEDADLIANAPADLAWLLSERAALLARVEAAERERDEAVRWGERQRDNRHDEYQVLEGYRARAVRERDELLARVEQAERAGAESGREPCTSELHSWSRFRPEQVDSYWMRCTKYAPHPNKDHEDSNTGATWTHREGDL